MAERDDTLSTRDIASSGAETDPAPDGGRFARDDAGMADAGERARFERDDQGGFEDESGRAAGDPQARADAPADADVSAAAGGSVSVLDERAAESGTHPPERTGDPAMQDDAGAAEPAAPTAGRTRTGADSGLDPLLPEAEQTEFRTRWEEIQTRFVDDPRSVVEEADTMVANVMQRLADGFAAERERLEQTWGRGEDVGTEELRVALQRYRSFFQRLLSA